MVSQDDYFSPVPVFILFRESIEASIIVSVLLSFLDRAGPWLKKQVWWGVGLGFCVSILIGVIFIIIYYAAKDNIFQGRNQFIFNGTISLLAAILIAYLAFAMLRFLGWEKKWERKLKAAALKAQDEEELALARLQAAEAEGGVVVINQTVEQGPPPPWYRRAFCCESAPKPETVITDPNAPKPRAPWWARVFLCEGADPVDEFLDKPPTRPSKAEVFLRTKILRQTIEEEEDDEEERIKKAQYLARMKAAHETLPRRQRYNIFFLAFFTVVREGLEVVVFLAGVGNSNASAIPLSGFVGIVCGICVGIILYYSGRTIENVKWLMIGMATVLFFIGAGQASNGGNSLMLGGAFGEYVGPAGWAYPSAEYQTEGLLPFGMDAGAGAADAAFNDGDEYVVVFTNDFNDLYINPKRKEQPWQFWVLWDISGCCSDVDEENRFLALCNKIFGYQDQPTFIDVVFYCGYWIIVLTAMLWKLWTGTLLDADYKHTRMMRKQAKDREQAREEEERAAALQELELKKLGVEGYSSGSEGRKAVEPESGAEPVTGAFRTRVSEQSANL